jgi:hypothetical protein
MKRTKQLERTAHHEAGHVVAGWMMGEHSRAVSIIPAKDKRYLGYHQSPRYSKPRYNPSPHVRRRLENIALVCLAGPAADRRFNPRGFRHYSGQRDRELAIDLLWHMSDTTEEADAYLRLVQVRASTLVENDWRTIEHFAEALLEKGTLMAEDIRETMISIYYRQLEEYSKEMKERNPHLRCISIEEIDDKIRSQITL